ncbi:MAG: hypothetical protein R6V26_06640 [Roseovarius sp.]
MTRKKTTDTGQNKPEDDPSEVSSTSQNAPDTPERQADAPTTGPFAHDPAKVVAPPNPSKLSAPADTTADEADTQATSQTTAPDIGDMSETTEPPDTDAGSAEEPAREDAEPLGDTRTDRETPTARDTAADATTDTVTIRQGGFWSMLFGGALAASIGVVASPYILSSEMLEGRVPAFLAPEEEGEDEVEAQLASQQDRLEGLEDRLDDLSDDIQTAMDRPDPPPDLSDEVAGLTDAQDGVESRIGEIEDRFGTIEEQVGDIGDRLTAVEERPVPTSDDSEVSSSEIESLRDRLEEQRADMESRSSDIEELTSRIETLTSDLEAQDATITEQRETLDSQSDTLAALREEADAEQAAVSDSARVTLQRAALNRVTTALETGSSFDDALADLRETDVEVPDALADVAETGAPTQAALTESFPDAAREALSRVRDAQDGLGAVEIGDFFRDQLGMRSLVPREGDDPDAILSRAEGALRDARLGDALDEIETLPEEARAALDDWVARAEQRQQALSAADELADRLN